MGDFNNPSKVMELMVLNAKDKATMPVLKMIILGFMAGIFIGLGGCAANMASHSAADAGAAKLISGAIFPVGLMLIVICGGELFTGNCLMITGVIDKKIKPLGMLKNLVVVYLSNLLGTVFTAFCVCCIGQLDASGGALGAYTIKLALGKVELGFGEALLSGVFCNILVCAAVLMGAAAKNIVGKIFGIFFPIFTFVICGFEHCIANMYYIPAAMFAASNESYTAKAAELYGITSAQLEALSLGGFLGNLLPVTLGNIIGGAVFIGATYYLAHKSHLLNDNM